MHKCDGKTHSDWLCWVAGSVVTQLADRISSCNQMRTEKETRLLVHIENARFGKVGDKVNQVKDQLSQGQGQYDNTLWEENISLSLSYSFLYFPICNW